LISVEDTIEIESKRWRHLVAYNRILSKAIVVAAISGRRFFARKINVRLNVDC